MTNPEQMRILVRQHHAELRADASCAPRGAPRERRVLATLGWSLVGLGLRLALRPEQRRLAMR